MEFRDFKNDQEPAGNPFLHMNFDDGFKWVLHMTLIMMMMMMMIFLTLLTMMIFINFDDASLVLFALDE